MKYYTPEKPCRFKHTCGFEICNMTDCPYYEAKTRKNQWAEKEQEDAE